MIERILFILAGLCAGLLLAQSPYLGAPSPMPGTDTLLKTQETPPTPSETKPQKSPENTANSNTTAEVTYPVIKVHDGDTLTITKDGQSVKVRLIGINAPEIYNYQKTPQCFGTEATKRAQELLEGTSVRIETDPSQDIYDKYGRLLAYAYLPNGTNVAEQLIREGYAHEYTYHLPYRYQKEFRAAQASAKTNTLGLWKSGVCTP